MSAFRAETPKCEGGRLAAAPIRATSVKSKRNCVSNPASTLLHAAVLVKYGDLRGELHSSRYAAGELRSATSR